MNIYLFDFDNTIVKLPYQETIEYLDQKESLDPELNFKLIERTKQDYLKALDYDPDGLFLILSNRIVEVKDSLNTLLNNLGYIFEDYYLIDGDDRNKGNRVRKILNKYKNCKSIKFWEDKDKHINSVTEVMQDYPEINLEIIKTVLDKQ
jgi:hypothetical protein|tara:strand:+ start:188 stop:634 length:447 start_codon:yes stop_codon:yes gene_type:complete